MPPIEDTSARADLEAAFEKHAADQEGGSVPDSQEPVRSTEEEPLQGALPDTKSADDAAKPDEGTPKVEPAPKAKPDAAKPDKSAAPDPAASKAEDIKAPVAWKAGAKAEWAKIPRAAQEEIARRETETTRALSQSVNARKHFDEFNQTIAPFMPLIRAQNSNPMAAIKNLMTTAAGLTVGNAEQKARIVTEMIQNFGVDIGILDQVLSGANIKQGQGAPGTTPMEVAIQRQLSPVFDFINGVKQTQAQREAQLAADADAEVNAFAEKNDLFDDVREEVADLMEMAAKRGKVMTLEQAFNTAVSLNPQLSAVVQQRTAAEKAQQRQTSMVRARAAASSIAGGPNMNPGSGKEPVNRRDDISAAWDELSNH